jgi:hypothetical protein
MIGMNQPFNAIVTAQIALVLIAPSVKFAGFSDPAPTISRSDAQQFPSDIPVPSSRIV